MRKFSSYAMITVKGIGMGAADVIPEFQAAPLHS